MSSGASQGGEAIRRGIELAIEEINARDGLLGRPLELLVRDHRGNPERGIDNILEFSCLEDMVAVFGGIHTPVVLRELESIHEHKMLFLVPWAAGTPITSNGYSPNYVFRVSVRDEYAGGFLVSTAADRGFRRLGLLLERTGWGRSNQRALQTAIDEMQLDSSTTVWFNWGDDNFSRHLQTLLDQGVEAVLFVGNPNEGVRMVTAMSAIEETRRVPVISHWGITGGDFFHATKGELRKIDLSVLQTHSFLRPRKPERSNPMVEQYVRRFDDSNSARDIFSPVGTAHAYELMMMLERAVKSAKSIDRDRVRDSLENLANYQGMIRDYERPFSADNHDALTVDDFHMARYDNDGAILPVED